MGRHDLVYMGPQERMPEAARSEIGLVPPRSATHPRTGRMQRVQSVRRRAHKTAHFSFLPPAGQDGAKRARTWPRRDRRPFPSRRSHPLDPNDPRPKFTIHGHDAAASSARAQDRLGDPTGRTPQFLRPNHAYTPTAFPGEIYYGQCWSGRRRDMADLHLLAGSPTAP